MTFTEESSQTLVRINAEHIQPGEYSLVLESFDLNSSVKSALKTDLIVIKVLNLPHFTSDLEMQQLTLGVPFEWDLPDIEEGSYTLSEVIV